MNIASKGDLREWFGRGVAQGYRFMLVVHDRMRLPDEPDFPAYRRCAGDIPAALAEYTVEGISKVREVYDLALDMETQLAEDRTWNAGDPVAAKGSRPDAGAGCGYDDSRYALLLHDIRCTFISRDNPGQRYTAVADTTLKVAPGEFVSVVGPTGCGKTTLLNVGAGLIEPSSGTVTVHGEKLTGINRLAGYMFQADALMPWKSALDNVIVGLLFRGVDPVLARERGLAWLTRVGLSGFEDRYPHQLSGGMRKRVAMAQTLILDPDIILMDEPFSALDVQTRQLMENELLDLWSEKKKAVLFITHDLDEAIALSDRVVVLSSGPATHPIGEFPIDLPRPRDVAEIRNQPHFTELHTRIWDVLRDEVLKGYIQHKNVAEE